MSRVARAVRAIRRSVLIACAMATLAVIAAPAAFGPAVGVMMRELGAMAQEHVCKCGMPTGKCGCPECDRLEQERLHPRAPAPIATLKSGCDRDAPAIPFGALPAGVLGAASTAALPLPRGDRLPVASSQLPLYSPDDEPPTPPPRSARV